ncbi:MAG: site-specific integrase [Paludibacter sp.]
MEREITQLIENCVQFFIENHYVKNRIDIYISLWRRGILLYMKKKEKNLYTPEIGQDFIRDCFPENDLRPTAKEMVRSIRVLDDYLKFGYIRPKAVVPVKHTLYGEIGKQMQKIVNHLQSERRSTKTIKKYELYLHRFLVYLNNEGVASINEISERHALKFVSTELNNKQYLVGYLRVLFRYWYENNISDENYENYLTNYKWTQKEKIPSYYDANEVQLIESSVDQSSRTGKRNCAILLLASRLGLRAADIANLQFSNIDWGKNEISLTQFKTGSPIKLPLLSDVGHAIIDYLKYGRFKSDSQQVFLSCRPPYVPATPGMVCGVIRGLIENSGVSIQGRRHGPHTLRHSLASSLLENGTPMPVISGVLGHEHTDTTMIYLRIDLTSLLKCALPVPLVSDDFYTQKGGTFYE